MKNGIWWHPLRVEACLSDYTLGNTIKRPCSIKITMLFINKLLQTDMKFSCCLKIKILKHI